jgi:formate hydrogenlyase subunit 3/multisubunit Na+/H+ antiporter MnhD subunit
MALINLFLAISLVSVIAILFANTRLKGIIVLSSVILNSVISSILAIQALTGQNLELTLTGTIPFGEVFVQVDALSAWFILTINFTVITSALYGLQYMKHYVSQKSTITLHCIAFVLIHLALLGISAVQNGMVFLMFWELMALSAFILIIFEHQKPKTIKAGTNYLVQSHISIVFLMMGFIYVAFETGSYNFNSITEFSSAEPPLAGTLLFLFFFVGFAIKAGFVPFHTWLPYAHPVAPTHISGLLSGVVIKIGIYGILRMILLVKADFTTIGYIILFISLVSGVYGVMLAIIQHNLKRLLAYHSIENIGIIGLGIGVGCLGLGSHNHIMTVLGFSGALLHTLNHSLFKSALFYASGNVYLATHTMNIERLGGVIKRMPQTAILFLIPAVAICGLPPLNGFISEFLIYGGIFNWLSHTGLMATIVVGFSLLSLVIIGGLAVMCFTKAFSVVFLGIPRTNSKEEINETGFWQLLPIYMAVGFILLIGLFPSLFLNILQQPLVLFTGRFGANAGGMGFDAVSSLNKINYLSLGFIVLILAVILLRKYLTRNAIVSHDATWGCAYGESGPKMQYTASSFIRSYTKLFKPLLDIGKHEMEITEVFPSEKQYETSPYDKIERYLIDKPLKLIKVITGWFLFLQNGRLQAYILYGIVFILLVICIPLLIEKVQYFLNLLNHL